MDKPDLVVACVVGDGEAETGPTATAWHGFKYIDPAESGAVLPIIHVNGFKISERTIYGTMDDKEMTALFTSVDLPTEEVVADRCLVATAINHASSQILRTSTMTSLRQWIGP